MNWLITVFLFLSGNVLAMGSPNQNNVETVKHVDLNRYLGTWYEIASIPQSFQKKCVANTVAEYSLTKNGFIKVLNSCDTKTGERKTAEARAKVIDKESNAKLKVTFVKIFDWVFSFGGNYWILDLAEDYSYAVVGDPTTEFGWILSRTPQLSHADLVSAEKNLAKNGYDTCKLLTSIQNGGFSERIPLCEVVK